MAIKDNDVILFQGDSITDAGRNRRGEGNPNNNASLGRGYAMMAAAHLLAHHAEKKLKVFNRGISGNKVFQLAERWDKDCLDIKPTIVSILIGVNDIWHKLAGRYDGTVKVYDDDYHTLIDRTRTKLPEATIVICEPFVLRCGAVDDKWFPSFDDYRASAKRQAEIFNLPFVPFQTMFDEAIKKTKTEPNYWAGDGVHPSLAGHQLMADKWLDVVTKA